MPLGTLRDRIIRKIKRPELEEDIIEAINDALEMIATLGDWSKDLVEGTLAISSSVYAQNIVISTNFVRFRKIKYLRPDGYSLPLTWKDPSRIFQKKSPGVGIEQVDVWYRAGDNIVFKLSVLSSNMLYGFYQYPERFDPTDYDDIDTHWYIDQMESAVYSLALSKMFEDMGNTSEATRLQNRALTLLELHKNDKMDGVVHS